MRRVMTAGGRRWVYGVAVGVFGVLAVYGLLDAQQVAAWSALAMAVSGLALVNTTDAGAGPTDPGAVTHDGDDDGMAQTGKDATGGGVVSAD